MWRFFMILGTGFFGLGALGGIVTVGFAVFEGDWQTAAGVGVGTAILAWMAWACRMDWRRENQRREG